MNIFLIDYENVSSIGLNGIDLLTKNDKIYLFYSEKAENINIDIMNIIINGSFKFKNFKLNKSDKNALDFQLVLFLGTMIKSLKKHTNFYIISNDNGYQSAIDFAKEHFNVDIKKFSSIYNVVNNIIPPKPLPQQPLLLLNEVVDSNSNLTKEQKRKKIEIKLQANNKLKTKLIDNQFKQISAILVDETKNTKVGATTYIEKTIGKKNQNLVPTILECCKEFIR